MKDEDLLHLLEQAVCDSVIECPECGNRIEPDAPTCGECGWKNALRGAGLI